MCNNKISFFAILTLVFFMISGNVFSQSNLDTLVKTSDSIPAFDFDYKELSNDIILSAKPDTINFLKGFFSDEKKLWTSPLHFTAKRYLFWAPVLIATAISLRHDEQIYSNFKSFQASHKWADKASPIITMGGENPVVVGTSLLFFGSGLIFKNQKAKQTGILSLQALAHAGLIVTVGKLITGRERPSYGNGQSTWHWFPASLKQFSSDPQPKYDAFPSGHTIAAWSVATVIAKQYSNNIIVPILAYSAATAVGLSRLTQDAHWFSDVIVGGALGYTIGSFVVKTRKNTHWTLLPISDGKNVFLAGTFKL